MGRTKAKRNLIILIIFIFLISFSVIIYASGAIITNPTTITFTDKNLYEAMKKQFKSKNIAYNENDTQQTIEVSIDDVASMTELNLQGVNDSKIADLTGLENFTNLTNLNLSGNAVTNATSISELTKIQTLNIADNPINESILGTLEGLTTLKELNMSNTQLSGDQLNYLKNLTNLKTLILAKNNISTVESISGLTGITKLDISVNKSFTDFTQLTSFVNLTELNVSGTGITTFSGPSGTTVPDGIELLVNLEKLYAQDNSNITTTAGINSIYATYKDGTLTVPYLSNLKVLNLSSIGVSGKRPSISFSNFAKLTSLEELHLASNDISSLSSLAKLENLKYIDLANNKIQSTQMQYFIQKKTVDGVEVIQTENTLKAAKIDLRGNEIIDISVLASYPADITWLDLSENHVFEVEPLKKHSFSEGLYLQNQDITFGLYKKTATVNHYIILPSIMRYSKAEGSFIYSSDAKLEFQGVTLNPDYTDPNEYNVIIDYQKTKDDILTVKLTGGVADGTILKFTIGSQGNVAALIESLLFVDENLDAAIYKELLKPDNAKNIKYLARVPKIININQDAIAKITNLDLQHTDSSTDTKIKDLTGLENFYNLVTLYLQNNDIKTIDPIGTCVKLQSLYLSNNSNLGNNNNAIEKLTVLTTLDLSNTGMTNIDSINRLTEIFISKKKSTTIVGLNISDNGLDNIDGIENITTLQSLSIANEKLDDEKISKLSQLTNLSTLNINGNQIENIDVLSSLENLKYLYFNNNKVQSLQPINGRVFYELEFTGNRVQDITPLSSHRTINNLKMDSNKIEDTSILSGISMSEEQTLSVTGQKIVRALDKNATGEVTVELPQIFKASQDSTNKLYTSSDLITTNCTLDSTGSNVVVNIDELNGDVAQVEIYGGKAHGTVLTIAPPLEANITYNPSNAVKTNQNITATITFNRSEVTIINNDGKNTYTFDKNGEFSFEFIDKYGFEGTETAIVQNIDKDPPVATVKKEVKNKQVIVTITVNEKVVDIDGWTSTELTNGKMTLTKTYSVDANENINLVDEAGNTTPVNIQVKIDKTNPVIIGVENGRTYNQSVTPSIQDESEYIVVLTKDGATVTNYKSGDTIKGSGQYVLTVTDIFDNSTTVSFEIAISDIITSKEDTTVTVVENENIVKDISPETTASALKQKLNAEMEYTIVDQNGIQISETAKVGTGFKIKMQNGKTYALIVKGDCNGDGQAELKDILAINKHRLNKTKLTAEYLQAADVTGDGQVELKDILQINKFRLGKTNEL